MRSYLDLETFETVQGFVHQKLFVWDTQESAFILLFEEHLEW